MFAGRVAVTALRPFVMHFALCTFPLKECLAETAHENMMRRVLFVCSTENKSGQKADLQLPNVSFLTPKTQRSG